MSPRTSDLALKPACHTEISKSARSAWNLQGAVSLGDQQFFRKRKSKLPRPAHMVFATWCLFCTAGHKEADASGKARGRCVRLSGQVWLLAPRGTP